ncbi:N-acetylglucosamine kinase [Brevibacillus sp. 7WMA2]|uniref:N-acetylglucosamine kinase n=1 Tax=Brevibacillus sp. 7WMA2 TaxID=2683193 RepID=UPI0013A78CEF|nr:BadF/BadG/BcrA/BcrD ATPase family protein [Brevibacillus sp. 7WMA2]QIC05935.1 N-acetylglucosamine kinase [Brevibacillus sp. 7WMA2]
MNQWHIPLLAVDGGGTKSLAMFVNYNQQVLGTGVAGSCNYHGKGVESATYELKLAIQRAINEAMPTQVQNHSQINAPLQVDCAVFGIAGLDTSYDRALIVKLVNQVLFDLNIQIKKLIVENDCVAALLGATRGKPGILAIAGTGSIVCGIGKDGKRSRVGGWGHLVGDEGSGYWIGKQALTAIFQASDGRSDATLLAEEVLTYLQIEDVEQLFHWVYNEKTYSVDRVGELSRLVSRAAHQGDQTAHRILERATDELFAGIKTVMDQLDLQELACQVILQGGVLKHEPLVRQRLIQSISEYAPQAIVDDNEQEPIQGVIAMGLFAMSSS